MSKKLLLRLVILVAAMMCALGAAAAEAYACYTSSNTTLTFYYDNQRNSRSGTTYELNWGYNEVGWRRNGTQAYVTKVVFDPSFADVRPRTTYDWFYGMTNLQSITGLEYLNTSEVAYMGFMFRDCSKLSQLDLSHFNTSNVTDMAFMFDNCSRLSQLDLSLFDTSNVTEMYSMFAGCSNLTVLDLSGWDTRNVKFMWAMFQGCVNLRTIYVGNGWSTSNVTSSTDMFANCTSLVGGKGTTYDPSQIDKSYAHIDGGPSWPGYFTEKNPEAYACYTPLNMTLTFYYDNQRRFRTGTTYDLNTGSNDAGWDTDGTKDYVTQVVFDPSFAVARPTTTFDWFYNMTNLQSITGLKYLNTSEVTNMGFMFHNCSRLSQLDLSRFKTSLVTNMENMFFNCSNLSQLDLSSFNTSRVTDMGLMFKQCSKLRTIYVGNGWSTDAVTYSANMVYDCIRLVGGKGTTYNEYNPSDKTYARIDGGPSNPGYFTAWGTTAYACYTPSNTTLTFYYDNSRASRTGTTYDLNTGSNDAGWDTDGTKDYVTQVVFDPSFAVARPTTTFDWFYNMTNLQSITGLKYLNTSEVTNMGFMFHNCSRLSHLDLSRFKTSLVTNMENMFFNCSNLSQLDLSSFNTSRVTDMGLMFKQCSKLRTIYVGNGWSTDAVTYSANMVYDCIRLVGGKGTTYNEYNPSDKTYARIDGGPSKPGYFTDKNAALRGDVNGDNEVNIADVNALIDIILGGSGNTSAADVNGDGEINIADVNALIDYILGGSWN